MNLSQLEYNGGSLTALNRGDEETAVYNVDTTKMIELAADIAFPLCALIGVCTNLVNLTIFAKLGLRDTVTVSFFSLSLSDFCFLFVVLANAVNTHLFSRITGQYVNKFHLMYMGIYVYTMFYDISVLTTTYIAVQRCCLVALPLKFRGMFTAKRNSFILVSIYLVALACYLPMFLKQRLAERTDPATNRTYLALWLAPDRPDFLAAHDLINRISLPIVTQLVVIVCLGLLVSNLKSSRRFRKRSSAVTTKDGDNNSGACSATSSSSSNREDQVVLAVTLVTGVYVITNTPQILYAFTRRFVSSFNLYQRHHNLYMMVNFCRNVLEFFSASVNMFIYTRFNKKFRNLLFRLQ
ncbi:uncharacterized protein LOC101851067 [Aplysia californica]|uniref:Uncharacterized protein LOC101851067 n=1 Tax=Aplysia californica TaxID=6500 RepID=A0ABM0K0F1_APLCA|nr:uncharacterized protein LOC101851067 [Aplysia californica]